MGHNASRRGAANLGMPLMIAAFIVIGGFLYWLYLQAEAERQLELQEAARIAAEEAEREAMGEILAPSALQLDASPYEGRIVSLEDVEVASALGTQGVWLDMPNGNPFLVSYSDSLRTAGVTLTSGQLATVTGTIVAMSDSIASSWVDAGTISEGDQLAATFATHFLQASRARATGMAEPDSAAAGGN